MPSNTKTSKGGKMRKIALAAIVVVAFLGATPAFAGYWSGTGSYVPWTEPDGNVVYPWNEWYGSLIDGSFNGNWEENNPKYQGGGVLYRTFTGSIISYYTSVDGGDTYGHCEGEWSRSHDGWYQACGWFTMEFNLTDGTCEGKWASYDKTAKGIMTGTGY